MSSPVTGRLRETHSGLVLAHVDDLRAALALCDVAEAAEAEWNSERDDYDYECKHSGGFDNPPLWAFDCPECRPAKANALARLSAAEEPPVS